MSGGSIIQWVALALCLVFAAVRLPDALRGRGRSVFAVLVLLVVAVALSLDPVYLLVDGLLGGVNIANLLIRLCLYAIMILLGMRCAAAFGSKGARTLISGPLGIAVLAITVIATIVLFVASDLPTSSTGLQGYADQETVRWYADLGRVYPAYVAACLLPPAVLGIWNRSVRPMHRLAAGLMSTGFFMVLVFATLELFPMKLGRADVLLPFGAIVLVTTGLTMIWGSRRRSAKEARRSFLAPD